MKWCYALSKLIYYNEENPNSKVTYWDIKIKILQNIHKIYSTMKNCRAFIYVYTLQNALRNDLNVVVDAFICYFWHTIFGRERAFKSFVSFLNWEGFHLKKKQEEEENIYLHKLRHDLTVNKKTLEAHSISSSQLPNTSLQIPNIFKEMGNLLKFQVC